MKVLITNNSKPAITIERTNNGDIKAVHLHSGIHATYHGTGHNHFFDPKSTRAWREEIEEMGAGHNGELVSCSTSRSFSNIDHPEFFICMSSMPAESKAKYQKLKSIEVKSDGMLCIYLCKSVPIRGYIAVLSDATPVVLIARESPARDVLNFGVFCESID